MPGESVAAYINNIITFIIFILVCIIIFILIYLVSSGIRKKVLRRNPGIPFSKTDGIGGGKSFTGVYRRTMADPFKKRNTALLGMSFILIMLFIILILASLYFSLDIGLSIAISLICLIIFSISVILVYIFRSGIIKK
ncbi:MAG TPA: hypothetical protein DCP02_04915 [Actinobacteria bacterium]|nr:hypothetical protein [Actinomycetota bacterium]